MILLICLFRLWKGGIGPQGEDRQLPKLDNYGLASLDEIECSVDVASSPFSAVGMLDTFDARPDHAAAFETFEDGPVDGAPDSPIATHRHPVQIRLEVDTI